MSNLITIYSWAYPNGNYDTDRYLQLDVDSTDEPKNNRTKLDWKVTVKGASGSYNAGNILVHIAGTDCYTYTGISTSGSSFPRGLNTSTSGTLYVTHDSNGAKTINITFKASVGWNTQGSWSYDRNLTTYDLTAPNIRYFKCDAATNSSSNATFTFTANHRCEYEIWRSGTSDCLRRGSKSPGSYSEYDFIASGDKNTYTLKVIDEYNGKEATKVDETYNASPEVTAKFWPVTDVEGSFSSCTFTSNVAGTYKLRKSGSTTDLKSGNCAAGTPVSLSNFAASNGVNNYELTVTRSKNGFSTSITGETDNSYTLLSNLTFSPISTNSSTVTFEVDKASTISFKRMVEENGQFAWIDCPVYINGEEHKDAKIEVPADYEQSITLYAEEGFNWYKIVAKTNSSGLVREYYNKTGNDTRYRTDNNRPTLSAFTYSLSSPTQVNFKITVNGRDKSSYKWKYGIEPLDTEFPSPSHGLNQIASTTRTIDSNTVKTYTVRVKRADCEITSNPETRSVSIDNRYPTIKDVAWKYNGDLSTRELTFNCNVNDCQVLWKKDPNSLGSVIDARKEKIEENSFKYTCTVPINKSPSEYSLTLKRNESHGSTSVEENIQYDGRYPIISLEYSVAGNTVNVKATAKSNVDGAPLNCNWKLDLMTDPVRSESFADASTVEHLFIDLPMLKDLVCVVTAEYSTGVIQSESTGVFQAQGFVYIKQEDAFKQGVLYVLEKDKQGNKIWVPGTPYVLVEDENNKKKWQYGTLSQISGGEE